MRKKNSPIPYLIFNKRFLFLMRLFDWVSSKLLHKRKKEFTSFPKKILLCNLAHMGDLVIATAIIPEIVKAFPKAKISFLIGSWTIDVLKDHSMIDQIFSYDHWKLNRSKKPFLKKLFHSMKTKRGAIKKIKKEKFDLSIDLYPYFPNSIHLLYKAKIPRRVGYSSGGFSAYLTDVVCWSAKKQYMAEFHKDILATLSITCSSKFLKPNLMRASDLSKVKLEDLLPREFIQNGYLLFHPLPGDENRNWSLDNWKLLTNLCIKKGYQIVFTGKGEKQRDWIDQITNSSNTFNAANLLTFDQTMQALANSKLIVTINTVISHMAYAACRQANVLIDYHHVDRWLPPIHIPHLAKKIPDLSFKSAFDIIACLKQIDPLDVMDQLQKQLNEKDLLNRC